MKQIDPPTCAHCGKPMEMRYRERVSGLARGVLFVDEPSGALTFQTDDSSIFSTDELETWWACLDFECEAKLRKQGKDWPYEQGFEGEIEYV